MTDNRKRKKTRGELYAPCGQRKIDVGSVAGSVMSEIIGHITSLRGGQFSTQSIADAGFSKKQASECLSRLNAQGMLIFEKWIEYPGRGGRALAVYTWHGRG